MEAIVSVDTNECRAAENARPAEKKEKTSVETRKKQEELDAFVNGLPDVTDSSLESHVCE